MKHPIFCRTNVTNASGITFAGLQYNIASSWDASEPNVRQVAAADGVLSGFYVMLDGAPGTAASGRGYVFEVMKNGVATGLAVSIFDTATSGVDNSVQVPYVAGDTLSLRSTATLTPASRGFSCSFDNESSNQNLFSGSTVTYANNATRYLGIMMSIVAASPLGGIASLIPTDGVIRNARIRFPNVPGATKSWTVTLVKNGTDTALVVVLSGTNNEAVNSADSVSVVAGDVVYWKVVPTNTPTASRGSIACEFVPAIQGESIQCSSVSTNQSATNANYVGVGASTTSYSTVEASRGNHTPTIPYVLKKLRALLDTAPSAGKSWNISLRNNGASTGVAATIADAATTASDVVNVATSVANTLLSILIQGVSTPTVSVGYYAFVTYKEPESNGNFLMFMRAK